MMAQELIKIEGKYYGLTSTYASKKQAEDKKDDLKNRGYKVRIKRIYGVYVDREYLK